MSFLSRIRAHEWWHAKIPPLLAIGYAEMLLRPELGSQQGLLLLGMGMLSICSVAAYGYVINDIFDLEADRLAGKPNALSSLRSWQRWLLAAIPVATGFAPLCFVDYGPAAACLLAVNYLLPTLYSAPPVRWKERGIWAVLADAGGAHVVPTLLLITMFAHTDPGESRRAIAFAVTAALWAAFFGWRGILDHQLLDRRHDAAAKVKTLGSWLAHVGAAATVFRALFLGELLLFVVLVGIMSPVAPLLAVASIAYLATELCKLALGWRVHFFTTGQYQTDLLPLEWEQHPNKFLYELWFPISLAIQLAWNSWPLAVLPALQLFISARQITFQWLDLRNLLHDTQAEVANAVRSWQFGWRLKLANRCRAEVTKTTPPPPAFRSRSCVRVKLDSPGTRLLDVVVHRRQLSLAAGQPYRLVFEARADAPRRIACCIDQARSPWKNLGLWKEPELTTQWQTYRCDFVGQADESCARLGFWVGGSDIPVELGDVQIERCAAGEQVCLEQQGDDRAQLLALPDQPGGVRVNITTPHASAWGIKIFQGPVAVQQGRHYRLMFRARADRLRSISWSVEQWHEPWDVLTLGENLELSPEWQTYRRDFVSPVNDQLVRLGFWLGGDDSSVELCDVRVVESPPGGPLYLIQQDDCRAQLLVLPDEPTGVRVTISRPHAQSWGIKLVQGPCALEENRQYCLKFRARADRARRIAFGVEQGAAPWKSLGLWKEREVSGDWQEFQALFIAAEDNFNARIFFGLGNGDVPVEIANLELAALDRQPAPALEEPPTPSTADVRGEDVVKS